MRSNASILAALLLLSGCGGGFGYAPETLPAAAPAPQQAGQGGYGASYGSPQDPYAAPAQVEPAPIDPYSVQARQGGNDTPGASYPQPGERAARPQRQQPRPQTYTPPAQAQDWQDPTTGAAGPAASSRGGEARYDEVGYAGVRGVEGGAETSSAVVAIARGVPADSFIEVTSLETGKTILALVTGSADPGASTTLDLSPAAARLLGASNGTIPVRVRKVSPTATDQAALRAGQPAGQLPDTPPVLLNALRKKLPAYTAPAPVPSRTAGPSYARPAAPTRSSQPARGGGYFVQVAALSNSANAQGLAQRVGGFVKPGGGLYRVQMGPYGSAAEAERARQHAAQQGFGDARVFTQP